MNPPSSGESAVADARDLLRTLAAEDRRGAMFCAALCAASVAHLVPVGERRPWRAVRLALAWGMGVEVPAERLRKAADAAESSSYVSPYACACACSSAAAAAAADAADAADAAAASFSAHRYSGIDAELDRLHDLVLHQITPVAPTPADVQRASPAVQVAWDHLVERHPDSVRISTPGEALARARRGRLRWTCPVERAIAERCDEAHLIELLATLRGRRLRYGVDARVPGARPHASSKARIGLPPRRE